MVHIVFIEISIGTGIMRTIQILHFNKVAGTIFRQILTEELDKTIPLLRSTH